MSNLSNNERLEQVAKALEELNAEVVYVGGAVVQLYSDDGAARNPMTTYDVDCVVDTMTYTGYQDFEGRLREKHFENDKSEGAPLCRYLFNGEKVDFMPKVDTGIGESNRWYLKGMQYRQEYRLDDGSAISIMPVPYYLASKLDALHSRGGPDYRGEKDFEDIVFVMNTCGNVAEHIKNAAEDEVRDYLREQFFAMIRRPNIREEIECALIAEESARVETVLLRMRSVLG